MATLTCVAKAVRLRKHEELQSHFFLVLQLEQDNRVGTELVPIGKVQKFRTDVSILEHG